MMMRPYIRLAAGTRVVTGGLAALTALLMLASVATGPDGLDLWQAIADLWQDRETLDALILVELRLPRAILAALLGAGLAMAGATLQGLLRNPLADPGVIGISGAAGFGAVCVFYSGLGALWALALPLGGITGALLATLVLALVARRGAGTTALILTGVAIGSFAAALTALALNLAPSPYAALEIVFWLMGSLADRSMNHVWLAAPPILIGLAMLVRTGRALEALTLGEDTARSLGFDITRTRLAAIIGTALAVGPGVAVAGAVGFVGLIVPHLMRPLVNHRPGRTPRPGPPAGAAFTLAADILLRLLPTRPELKLGVVMALIGAPFLASLILSVARKDPR